jgi:menaquinone-specific isochorismate synthase
LKSLPDKALRVQTKAISLGALGKSAFLELLTGSSTAFLTQGEGLIGFGEELRLEASGPNRIDDLNQAWQNLVKETDIEDELAIPGSGLIAFGTIAFSDHSAATSVLVIPKAILGQRSGQLWITLVNTSLEEALTLITQTKESESEHLRFEAGQISTDQFKTNIANALAKIEEHSVEKVVLARDILSNVSEGFENSSALKYLATNFESCFTYSVDGLFGASPELLVKVSHSQVSARVLAGTAGRGTDPGVDEAIGQALTSSQKNLDEHKYAIDSLVSALAELAENIDADETPFSLALPNLWHLASDVHAVLKAESSSLQVVKALHPSAAVAGTPRDKALELIQEIEQLDRGRYAGPVGWIGADGDGAWAIALRGAQLDKTKNLIRAFAGCGIVAGSTPDAELAETNLKFKPILDALS